jgi:hypothetical protein
VDPGLNSKNAVWSKSGCKAMNSEKNKYDALVYILDRHGRKCRGTDGHNATTLVTLEGDNRQDALASLDTKLYEFKKWW